jgi:signal transduction histidine kinase
MLNDARAARRFIDAPVARLAEARASIHALEEQGQRAREVLLHMRRALRKDPVEEPVTDLSQGVRDAVRLVEADAQENEISFEAAFPAAGPLVPCDPVQLQQVLLNLLLNAIDAVRAEAPGRRRVRIDVQTAPDSVEVTVRDWGKGISPEDRARLFEPFFTTKSSGLGMGLNISRSIIEAHGGRIVAHAQFDQGAAFSFVLPLASPGASTPSLEAI